MKNSIGHSKTKYLVLGMLVLLSSQILMAYDENRSVGNFSKISYTLPGDLYITQGDSYSIRLEGDKEDVENIITRLEGESLSLIFKSHWKNKKDIKIYITMPELDELSLAGSGNVFVNEKFESDEMEFSLAGSGDINFSKLKSSEVEISIAGSGSVNLSGTSECKELEISIAGSGDVNVSKFKAEEVSVSVVGSGSVRVFASSELDVSSIGSGSVFYLGSPVVNSSSLGSGKIVAL